MKALILATIFSIVALPVFADAPPAVVDQAAQQLAKEAVNTHVPMKRPPLKKETHFIGPGIKRIRAQVAFPVRHPVKFSMNCSYPLRHPLEASCRTSNWIDEKNLNPGLSAGAAGGSMIGSAGIFGLYGKKGGR